MLNDLSILLLQGLPDVCNISAIMKVILEPWVQESGQLESLHKHCRDVRDAVVAKVPLYVPSDVLRELCVWPVSSLNIFVSISCKNSRMADTVIHAPHLRAYRLEQRGEESAW